MRDFDSEEAVRRMQREQRRAQLWQQKKRRHRRIQILAGMGIGICAVLLLVLVFLLLAGRSDSPKDVDQEVSKENYDDPSAAIEGLLEPDASIEETDPEEAGQLESELPFAAGYAIEASESAALIGEDPVKSTYALLVDLDTNRVIAQKNAYERINPASMTKILTVLVAAEHITDMKDTFTITREITDYSYRNDCSAAGFGDGETVTIEDLMYGTVLPSGADAAAGLAYYVSGSLEDFVVLMNDKLSELGLSDTAHFTNCVGLYDENHYCTIYDMAIILKAAVENERCREVLSAHRYTTSPTEEHPEGIELSNWFLRRIEDKETNGEVVCAKTGFVAQSGSCAASYLVAKNGKHYICVTADTYSSWRCIYDHVAIYQEYTR